MEREMDWVNNGKRIKTGRKVFGWKTREMDLGFFFIQKGNATLENFKTIKKMGKVHINLTISQDLKESLKPTKLMAKVLCTIKTSANSKGISRIW